MHNRHDHWSILTDSLSKVFDSTKLHKKRIWKCDSIYLRKLSRFSRLFSNTALVIDTFYQRKGTLFRNILNTNRLNYSIADRFLSIGWVPMS